MLCLKLDGQIMFLWNLTFKAFLAGLLCLEFDIKILMSKVWSQDSPVLIVG